MDATSAPGGFLGAFVLMGILLPISGSFVLDGVVYVFRGRGVRMLLLSSVVTILVLGLYYVAWQNGTTTVSLSSQQLTAPDTMNGAIGLVLLFSVPAVLVGFGLRMANIFLNPKTRARDRQLIESRALRRRLRTAARPRIEQRVEISPTA